MPKFCGHTLTKNHVKDKSKTKVLSWCPSLSPQLNDGASPQELRPVFHGPGTPSLGEAGDWINGWRVGHNTSRYIPGLTIIYTCCIVLLNMFAARAPKNDPFYHWVDSVCKSQCSPVCLSVCLSSMPRFAGILVTSYYFHLQRLSVQSTNCKKNL